MLSDRARIQVTAGRGGDGSMSFRREAHVPKGGPDGGDGGRGGDVVLVCDDSLRDLQSFKRRSHYKAPRGRHGEGSQRHGADGDDLVVKVPPGTVVLQEDDGTEHDLLVPGQRAVVAKGGSGGRGNRHFRRATHQAPRFAERGLEGEERWLDLRLKLLADVGLVGLPNAGKSSLLSRITRAAPKVADYPFTTLEPVLGTLDAEDRQLVIADIPGLIEGAAGGAGLGHDFLAHVERTRLLVHVLDLAPLDGSDPEQNFETIEAELAAYDQRLASLPRIVTLSKADLVSPEFARAAAERWRARFAGPEREAWELPDPDAEVPVIVTSSATGEGLDDLKVELLRRVPVAEAPVEIVLDDGAVLPEHRVFRPAAGRGFRVAEVEDGVWRVEGDAVERLIARHDLDNEDALSHVEHRLHRLGVIRALEAEGFQPGDEVEIGGVVFELDPG
ncbi:MAG TPA: GTPase ObgE [Baekduia sp.]|nr:GTPase ObgE [Baekduia sp.]